MSAPLRVATHALLRWGQRVPPPKPDLRDAYEAARFVGTLAVLRARDHRIRTFYGYRWRHWVFLLVLRRGRWGLITVWPVAVWERRWARQWERGAGA